MKLNILLRAIDKETLSNLIKLVKPKQETLTNLTKLVKSNSETLSNLTKLVTPNPETLSNLTKLVKPNQETLSNLTKQDKSSKETLSSLKNLLDKTLAEAPQYLSRVKTEQQKIMYDKIKHLNKWYTKIIGLDVVQVYQERVTALQDQLLNTQTKRRELNTQLTQVRHKAQEVQSQIQHIDRKEKFDVYCQLINDERTILNMEKSLFATFQEYDQAERDLFTAFTNSVRDSQEKQRAQLEYSKYIGLALSIIGSFLTFVYTFFWKQDLKLYIREEVSTILTSVDIKLKNKFQPPPQFQFQYPNYAVQEVEPKSSTNIMVPFVIAVILGTITLKMIVG